MKRLALALLSFILPLSAPKTLVEIPENIGPLPHRRRRGRRRVSHRPRPRRGQKAQNARAAVVARPRKTHGEPPPPARVHMGGRAGHIAGREKNLPRGPAEIPGGPIDGQDAARVAAVAAAVEKTPGAVLGHAAAGVSDTPSMRRFFPEPRPRRARTRPRIPYLIMFCPTYLHRTRHRCSSLVLSESSGSITREDLHK